MMRLYFTPVSGYSILYDIQHFMNFNSLLVSALLQFYATFIMKGWIPVYPWGSQPIDLGNTGPWDQRL